MKAGQISLRKCLSFEEMCFLMSSCERQTGLTTEVALRVNSGKQTRKYETHLNYFRIQKNDLIQLL